MGNELLLGVLIQSEKKKGLFQTGGKGNWSKKLPVGSSTMAATRRKGNRHNQDLQVKGKKGEKTNTGSEKHHPTSGVVPTAKKHARRRRGANILTPRSKIGWVGVNPSIKVGNWGSTKFCSKKFQGKGGATKVARKTSPRKN